MRFLATKSIKFLLCLFFVLTASLNVFAAEKADIFSDLRGKWAGTGTMALSKGRKERLICDAQYTGSASQLILLINCKSNSEKIRMHAKLSANAGVLLGTWNEETYKAVGSISGKATDNKITFYISGNVLGNMTVRYTKTRQNIAIKTTGVSLEDVKIVMTRR